MFDHLIEEIRRDITNVRPYIMKKGGEAVMDIKINKRYSRTKLRKWGLLSSPWKIKGTGWKPKK